MLEFVRFSSGCGRKCRNRLSACLLVLVFVFSTLVIAWPPAALAQTEVSGNITTDTVWSADKSPYLITGSVTVQGTDGSDGVTTLTIEPGVEVRFARYAQLQVGNYSGDPGALKAEGTAQNPIVFTSAQDSPAPGDWYGLRFYNTTDAAGTILDHCRIEYAGLSQGAVYVYQSSPVLKHSSVSSSKSYGFYIQNGSPTIDGCSFTGSQDYDLYFTGTSTSSISNCVISNGIYYSSNQGRLDFAANTLSWDNEHPVHLPADTVGAFLAGTTITNTDDQSLLEVGGGTIIHDATWTDAIRYKVNGTVYIRGTDGSDGVTTLTIEPGVEVRFARYAQLQVGNYSGDPGALKAEGTADAPIVFTSGHATPSPGDWYGLQFYNTADDSLCKLSHCLVEYAGSSQGALGLNNASPRVFNTTFRFSKNYGLYAFGSGCNQARVNCCTFTSNTHGVYLAGGAVLQSLTANNFKGNTQYGLYYSGSAVLLAENNWWNDPSGPNKTGDKTYGNIDTTPWSTAENDCNGTVQNLPPNVPNTPSPSNNAVRVPVAGNKVGLSWQGDDPNPLDTVTYDLYSGSSQESLALTAADLQRNLYSLSEVEAGRTLFWKVAARDNHGAEVEGPVWRFTTAGDPPDLVVAGLSASPGGNLKSGQDVAFTATLSNPGSGPVVDPFKVDFKIDGAIKATATLGNVIPASGSAQVVFNWTCTGGNPSIEIVADSQGQVSETNEDNNRYITTLNQVADNMPPQFTASFPADGAHLKQIAQVTVTLADSQSEVDDGAVIASFKVQDGSQQAVTGTISESGDVFTFRPASLPLADGTYQVSFVATDTYGNSQDHAFSFTIDTRPPPKPEITGGTVQSGTIAPRPAANTAGQFMVELTGTRQAGTSVFVNGEQKVETGDSDWSTMLMLQPGDNTFEVWLVDRAGNRGPSEWVDIHMSAANKVLYHYDAAGRLNIVGGQH